MSKPKLLWRQWNVDDLCYNCALGYAIAQLTRIQQTISERKGVNAKLYFEVETDEEASCAVRYQSPETATEQKKRLLEEALRKQKKVKDKSEAKEQRKRVYLKLKKEFEGM